MAYEVTDKSTAHGLRTPHGYNTPHKYPSATGEDLTATFEGLSRQLYPTGRAWYMKRGGVFDRLHKGLNRSFIRLINAGRGTLDSVFPDNINFDEDDASLWEYRLGLITNESLSIEVRRDAILRKMAYPNNVRARQHPLFIQGQLQKAGFDVWIHENRFFEGGEWVYRTPTEIAGLSLIATQHGGDTQHGGGTQHGSTGFQVIANQSTPTESYNVGGYGNLWATFFIGGETLGSTAIVPETRLREFKELVLKLKPAHTVAFTFVSYS